MVIGCLKNSGEACFGGSHDNLNLKTLNEQPLCLMLSKTLS